MIPLPFVEKQDLELALEYLYKGEVTVERQNADQIINALAYLGVDVTKNTKIQDTESDDDQNDDDDQQQNHNVELQDREAGGEEEVTEAQDDEPGDLMEGGDDLENVPVDPLEEKLRCVICNIIFTQVGSRNRHMRAKHGD